MSPPQIRGFQKYGALFFLIQKKRLQHQTHELGDWYQHLGTKIYGEPERWSLSVCRGACCKPPARGSGGLEAPQEQQGLGDGSTE